MCNKNIIQTIFPKKCSCNLMSVFPYNVLLIILTHLNGARKEQENNQSIKEGLREQPFNAGRGGGSGKLGGL